MPLVALAVTSRVSVGMQPVVSPMRDRSLSDMPVRRDKTSRDMSRTFLHQGGTRETSKQKAARHGTQQVNESKTSFASLSSREDMPEGPKCTG